MNAKVQDMTEKLQDVVQSLGFLVECCEHYGDTALAQEANTLATAFSERKAALHALDTD